MEVSNSELMKVRLWIVSEGDNQHQKPIPWQAIEKARPTLVGKPIVAKYDRYNKDLMSHELDEVAVGVVLSDSDIFYATDEDGKRWLCADGIIWCRYAKDVAFVLDRDQIKNLSMEIIVLETGEDNSIELFSFSGITLIGTTPAIPNARVEVLSFSAVVEEVKKLMNFDSNSPQYKIPDIVKQNAEKGIALKAKNPKGATVVNISIANQLINNEFASLDLLHNIVKFSEKSKTETAQYLMGGFESLEWAENITSPQIEEFKEVQKEDDKVPTEEIEKCAEMPTEEMSSDQNTEAVAQAENADDQAEADKETVEEEMAEVIVIEVVIPETESEEVTEDDVVVADDYQAMFAEMATKCSALEAQMSEMTTKMSTSDEQMAVYMAENEQLKKFKADVEEKQMMSVIEYTFSEVIESMPKDKMEELREDAKNFSTENINIWVNKVKAEAFSFSKGQLNNDGITRIGLPFVNTKKESNSLWDKI